MAEPKEKGKENKEVLPENWSDLSEVKELVGTSVKDAVSRETTGLKDKNDELLGEVKKFKKIAKSVEELGDLDLVKEAVQKVRDLEEKKLMDEGEIDKLFEKKTARMVGDHETKVTALSERNTTLESEVTVYKDKLAEVTIEGGIRDALMEVEGSIYEKAWPDAMARGKRIFTLNDKGEPEPRDENGIIYGKDATTPITFKEWAESLKETADHLWEAHSQGGSGGLPSSDSARKGKTLQDQLAEAIERGDMLARIKLKGLIANEQAAAT